MNIPVLMSFLKKNPPGVVKYVLYFLNEEEEREDDLFERSVDEVKKAGFEIFAKDILDICQSDAKTRKGNSRYRLRCIDKHDKSIAHKTIKEGPDSDPEKLDPLSIGPVGENAHDQLLRISEALLRNLVGSIKTINDSYTKSLDDLRHQIADAREREHQLTELLRQKEGIRIENEEASAKRGEWIERVVGLAEKHIPTISEQVSARIAKAIITANLPANTPNSPIPINKREGNK